MIRACTLMFIVVLSLADVASAQAPGASFRWQNGQVLDYRAEHVTSVAEVVEGSKVDSSSKLNVVKRWQVTAVDAQGVATVQLTLKALRHEQLRPNGETLLYDSENPAKSTPELRDQMGKFIGQTLAVLRIDAQGRVLEVKQGSAERYQTEPPFVLVLPGRALADGLKWKRPFQLVLDPPQGTGEKHDAEQIYQCTGVVDHKATISVETKVPTLPASPLDRVPLLQKQTKGQVVFDTRAGVVDSVQLSIDQTLQDHQGQGSSYRFQSSYTEKRLAE